ncbi:chorion class B protein M3A5 [Selaginella moellendorffii]|uniref:chorion class B protein M3A5 n=1 Tax=Selaginella moellendorffii TaxID=88036 RepID=UPI000D1CB90D|nr:chorion class B protein M3A5 [Selaginella moellendorffii]|eukprot:XP_024532236.1 chorion class B protein M3A5 [Selaginella moellendorffii]
MKRREEMERGLLWKLPLVKSSEWGKLGPAFGAGVGCGVGVGAGIIGGAGLGFGFPGFQFGVGLGAGCGIGVGFGYGLGKGRAYDENGSYSNMGRYSAKRAASSGAEIRAIVDDFVSGMRRALASWESELQKRRRS